MAMGTHKGVPPEWLPAGDVGGWQSHQEGAQAPPNRKSLKAGDLRALEEMDPQVKHTRSLGLHPLGHIEFCGFLVISLNVFCFKSDELLEAIAAVQL